MTAPILTNNLYNFPKLNLPQFEFKIRQGFNSNYEIFDIFRKKYIILTPEEWVRQNFATYMVKYLNYPISRMKLEYQISLANNNYRADIVYFDKMLNPKIIVECKSTKIKINTNVFNQIALYNMALSVKYLIVTNGIDHYVAEIDYINKKYNFLNIIPEFSDKL